MPRICRNRLLNFAAVWSLLLAGTPVRAAGDPASELAQSVIQAYGGSRLIDENQNRGTHSTGQMISKSSLSEASNRFDCHMYSKGDKMRVEMIVLGNRNILAYDGKISWTKNGDWVALSTPTSIRRLAEEIRHGLNALSDLDDPRYKLVLLPDKAIDGKTYRSLKVIAPDGLWTIFRIDPATRLVFRSEFIGNDSEQGVEVQKYVNYSDYRTVDGMPVPFKYVELTDGKESSQTVLVSVTTDDGIGDEMFAMPPESKVPGIADGPVVLPFEFVGNEIIVSARLNDQQEAKFVVDTGASQTVVDSRAAQALGPITSSTFNVTAGSKSVALNYTKIEKLKLGDVSVENVAALVKDLSSFAAAIGQRPAGLIGANVLRRFFVTVDYQNKKLVLADPSSPIVPASAKVIKTSPVFGASALVVPGRIDNKQEINLLVDTGAAFNNLPRSLAAKLDTGPVLPVGQIFGLDGKAIEIGSVKFKSLDIGTFRVDEPVFVIQPDKSAATGGLFSAKAMATIGNPLWGRSKISVDYRNERLIIEEAVDMRQGESLLRRLRELDRAYLKNSNTELAIVEFEKVLAAARQAKLQSVEALCIARLAGCYADKYMRSKETRFLDQAVREYEKASLLAAESKDRQVEGQILAQWSMFHLNAPRSNTDLVSHLNLLKRAFNRAPNDATIYAALGSALIKTGKVAEGRKFINQALMFDPSNWQALWAKFRLAEAEYLTLRQHKSRVESEQKLSEMRAVVAQLQRYYADFPQVKEARMKADNPGSASGKPAAAPARVPRQ